MTEPAALESPAPTPALDLGVALALATGLVYTAGWAYAYRWFARFDLGLAGLGLPFETLLMYGFWVLRQHWPLLLLYLVGMLLWSWHGAAVRVWMLRTAPLWLLIAFVLFYLAGGQSADARFEAERAAGFGCFPRALVGLQPQDRGSGDVGDLAAQLAERQYRLLIQTETVLVLIKPKRQGPPVTALVPLENLDALRLSDTQTTCRP